MAKRTEAAVAALQRQLGPAPVAEQARRPAEDAGGEPDPGAASGGHRWRRQQQQATPGGSYTGPTGTQAEKAVAFVYGALGCPYVYGATGPCQDGYDCSGLTMMAWASAGVSIPRTSYGQATLPSVSESDLQPGDILEFAGDSHVGLYVGGGMLIDAPQTGEDVEKVSLSSSWYASNFDGAVRP